MTDAAEKFCVIDLVIMVRILRDGFRVMMVRMVMMVMVVVVECLSVVLSSISWWWSLDRVEDPAGSARRVRKCIELRCPALVKRVHDAREPVVLD